MSILLKSLSRKIIIEIIAELIYQMLVGLAKLQGTLDLHQVCFYYRYVSLGGKWFVIYCYYGYDLRLEGQYSNCANVIRLGLYENSITTVRTMEVVTKNEKKE